MMPKSSLMILAAVFLGQSAVLSAPIEDNSITDPYSPADCPKEKYDHDQSHWGDQNGVVSDPTHTSDTDITDPSHEKEGGYYGHPKQRARGSLSDPSFQYSYYGGHSSNGKQDPEDEPEWGVKNGVAKDPTHTEDPYNNTAYPVEQHEGDSCEKKSRQVDGTISDPTYTEEPSNGAHGGDSYGKPRHSHKNVNGTISAAEGRLGHTPNRKPCIVPNVVQNDTLPYGETDHSYLGGKKEKDHCKPDDYVWQPPSSFENIIHEIKDPSVEQDGAQA